MVSAAFCDRISVAAVVSVVMTLCAQGASVTLVDDGRACCRVVVDGSASHPERFGAREIATYLDRTTGCGILDGDVPIRLSVDATRELKGDAFEIEASGRGVSVVGGTPRAVLYGCYELLKEYAGMRWYVPGEDGEYCLLRGRSVVVPYGRRTYRPSLLLRETRLSGETNWLWCARNNLQCETALDWFADAAGRRTRKADRLEELAVGGIGPCGHVQTMLLHDAPDFSLKDKSVADRNFAAHPDWYPLIRGKRMKITTAGDPNPCVSNEAYLDHAAEVIIRRIDRPHGRDGWMTIGNNDTTTWCECERCRALDAPERKGTKGAMSDRYWHMVGGIARRVWEKFPDAKIAGWAYQNYWYPPVKTKIDPRIKVLVSFNNQCWRHSCLDASCPVNAEMRKVYSMWREKGLPFVVNRDEIACEGCPGFDFLPAERVLWQNFRDYPKMGCSGSHLCLNNNYFERMWRATYLAARFMWDTSRDYSAEYEEVNAHYFGMAWEGGMRDFCRCLEKAFYGTPGCTGYIIANPLGRSLDCPGTETELKECLSRALVAAKRDPDPRTLRHVAREKRVFEETWIRSRREYERIYREHDVYPKRGTIVIDGVLDEKDWRQAKPITGFEPSLGSPVKTNLQQTVARVIYDLDALYIGVEAFEPLPDKTLSPDCVELYYSYPDMFDTFYRLLISSRGALMDWLVKGPMEMDDSFSTAATYKVKKGADRWTLEIAIPTNEIGLQCFAGSTWRFNCGRNRHVEGLPREGSSCCGGLYRSPSAFIHLKFLP